MRSCGATNTNCSVAESGHYAVINGMAFFEDTVNWSGDYGKWLILGKGDNQNQTSFIFLETLLKNYVNPS